MNTFFTCMLCIHCFYGGVGTGLSIYMKDTWPWTIMTGGFSFVCGPWPFIYYRVIHYIVAHNPRRIP